jgi:hypothetical protein
MQNIKLVRLFSGEEILATVENGFMVGTIALKSPYILVPGEGGRGIALSPWMPYCKMDGVEVNNPAIVFTVDPQDQLRDYYIEVTSGIVTRAAKLPQ